MQIKPSLLGLLAVVTLSATTVSANEQHPYNPETGQFVAMDQPFNVPLDLSGTSYPVHIDFDYTYDKSQEDAFYELDLTAGGTLTGFNFEDDYKAQMSREQTMDGLPVWSVSDTTLTLNTENLPDGYNVTLDPQIVINSEQSIRPSKGLTELTFAVNKNGNVYDENGRAYFTVGLNYHRYNIDLYHVDNAQELFKSNEPRDVISEKLGNIQYIKRDNIIFEGNYFYPLKPIEQLLNDPAYMLSGQSLLATAYFNINNSLGANTTLRDYVVIHQYDIDPKVEEVSEQQDQPEQDVDNESVQTINRELPEEKVSDAVEINEPITKQADDASKQKVTKQLPNASGGSNLLTTVVGLLLLTSGKFLKRKRT